MVIPKYKMNSEAFAVTSICYANDLDTIPQETLRSIK